MKSVLSITAVLALTALFASCNQSTTPGSNAPSAAETQAIGDSMIDEAASSSATLTLESSVQSLSFSGELNTQAGRACVTVTPNPVVDTDADGVPDNATYTFNCSLDRPLFAYGTSGTLQVSDPSSASGTVGFDSSSNLTRTVTNKSSGVVTSELRSGVRSPRKTGDQIVQSHNITVTRTVGAEPAATITNLWNLTFAAATPGSIALGAALPAGSLSFAGNYSFQKAGVTRTFAVSTFAPLQYDPSCNEPLKIVGGKLRAFLNGASANAYLEITFGACGTQPSTKGFFVTGS